MKFKLGYILIKIEMEPFLRQQTNQTNSFFYVPNAPMHHVDETLKFLKKKEKCVL